MKEIHNKRPSSLDPPDIPCAQRRTKHIPDLQLFRLLHPYGGAGIGRHPQITAGGNRHAADLRSVRQAGTLELLRKKSLVKGFEPFQYDIIVIYTLERPACNPVYFRRLKTTAQHIV